MIIVQVLCSWSQLRHEDNFLNSGGGQRRSFLTSSLPARTGITRIPALSRVRWTPQCFGTDAEKDENVLTS